MKSKRVRTFSKLTLGYLGLLIIAAGCIYPALWVVMSSLRQGTALYSESLIPSVFTLEHYRELFERYPYGQWFLNTLKISFFTMVLTTIIVTLTGYVFSKFRFYGRRQLMLGLLVIGMFPGFMSMIAIYILLLQLKLLDTHLALILVYSSGASMGFLYVKSFFDTIPASLLDAAKIDGASHWIVFSRIMLPLSKPMLVFVALTSFSGGFVDFIFANMVLSDNSKLTLAVGLFKMVKIKFATEFTLFAAGCVLVAIPITALFIFLQRYLVEGLTAGAEKG
ncbi:Maltose/maltodextrin transport system permease protein MalG [Paenibacillus plantiphilus]|uniref:Maltose/maltodextrin transport system permease protein MalG n=1 Tax=Paenibacillus plantiphilus TaxID=2905650 RepID=A0ABM9CG41_9BACL|nr:sugar ABC transporter permease [Paenibacillus plantiphilus]CAH1211354.1 Maltose/maltodextrin transport system permease protein MalG [Paenibacillus plantiphilus]